MTHKQYQSPHHGSHGHDQQKLGSMHFGTDSEGDVNDVPVSAPEVHEPSGLEHHLGDEPAHG